MFKKEKMSIRERRYSNCFPPQEFYDQFVQYLVYQQSQVEDNTDVIKDFVHRVDHDNLEKKINQIND
jgi:hypothetical protein